MTPTRGPVSRPDAASVTDDASFIPEADHLPACSLRSEQHSVRVDIHHLTQKNAPRINSSPVLQKERHAPLRIHPRVLQTVPVRFQDPRRSHTNVHPPLRSPISSPILHIAFWSLTSALTYSSRPPPPPPPSSSIRLTYSRTATHSFPGCAGKSTQ
ncbi:hypothetical protein BJV77DRAFT_108433 [Russula vinacea]|nr:hypothetical protein BJV77DRAFT_108433 [Russula vinacea]